MHNGYMAHGEIQREKKPSGNPQSSLTLFLFLSHYLILVGWGISPLQPRVSRYPLATGSGGGEDYLQEN